MLAKALMGTVQSLDIGRMQLGQFLLELRYLQNTTFSTGQATSGMPVPQCCNMHGVPPQPSILGPAFGTLLNVRQPCQDVKEMPPCQKL